MVLSGTGLLSGTSCLWRQRSVAEGFFEEQKVSLLALVPSLSQDFCSLQVLQCCAVRQDEGTRKAVPGSTSIWRDASTGAGLSCGCERRQSPDCGHQTKRLQRGTSVVERLRIQSTELHHDDRRIPVRIDDGGSSEHSTGATSTRWKRSCSHQMALRSHRRFDQRVSKKIGPEQRIGPPRPQRLGAVASDGGRVRA